MERERARARERESTERHTTTYNRKGGGWVERELERGSESGRGRKGARETEGIL